MIESKIESKPIADNIQKYYNYREQMTRLHKSLKQQFYLESIFIEYSIMEDRLESILRHAGEWEKMVEKQEKKNRKVGIDQKINKVQELARVKKSLENKYFGSDDIMETVRTWKDERNPLTHARLKRWLHTEDLAEVAIEGYEIVKRLCSKATSYRRAVEKIRGRINQH